MKFFRIALKGTAPVVYWATTLKGAHNHAKARFLHCHRDVLIEEIEVPTDKVGVFALLSGASDVFEKMGEGGMWVLTARGGLEKTE